MRKNLKDARNRLGLSAKDMAAKLFITRRYYLSIEQGTRTGDYTIWDALEDITGTNQRLLRENVDTGLDPEDSQPEQ